MGGLTSYSAVLMLARFGQACQQYSITQLSLPVPRQFKVANVAGGGVTALERIGGTVVVKPIQGNKGVDGMTTWGEEPTGS